MKHPRPIACDFMFYKDYEIDLKFFLVTCIVNTWTQDLACFLAYQHVTIHYCVILTIVPGQFPQCIPIKIIKNNDDIFVEIVWESVNSAIKTSIFLTV